VSAGARPQLNQRTSRIVCAAALLLASVAAADACGTERQLVQIAADQNAVSIADIARTASIADLAVIAAPSQPGSRPVSRFVPAELTVYEVAGTLVAIEREPDGDYRLVIADPDHPQITMIAESPDPVCASASRFTDNIAAVRHALDQKFGQFLRLTPGLPMTATGIVFFDTLRGRYGAAPNGVELAPLIGVFFP
jgi:hypothetical protein